MSRRLPPLLCLLLLGGCGEPSEDERENRKSFEFLLTAVSLKNPKEPRRTRFGSPSGMRPEALRCPAP